MIEGELKKRLDLAYSEIRKISGDVNWTKMMLDASKQILDEAVKEFPNKNDEKYKDRTITKYNKNGFYKFKLEQYMNDVEEWRKKWLGEHNSPET